MSELNGTLRDFPLRQVLKLVESGRKSGILVVTGDTVRGSVFFRDGNMIFATTRSGPADAEPTPTERRNPTGDDHKRLLASVIMRLLRLEDGSFVFQSGVEPMHPTIGDLTVSEAMEAAEELLASWDQVESTLGSMRQTYTPHPASEPTDVVLTPEEWNVIAVLGFGRSAAQVAMELGISEYAAATTMARLIDRKLIVASDVPSETDPSAELDPPTADRPQSDERESSRGHDDHASTPAPVTSQPAAEPTLAERYEFYVNSRGSELREPPPPEPAVVLDLTQDGSASLEVRDPVPTDALEPEPASELARRWRDLRRGKLPHDE